MDEVLHSLVGVVVVALEQFTFFLFLEYVVGGSGGVDDSDDLTQWNEFHHFNNSKSKYYESMLWARSGHMSQY